MNRIYAKTIYVDEDGVAYSRGELAEVMYIITKKTQKVRKDKHTNQSIVYTTNEIKISGSKPKQLELF